MESSQPCKELGQDHSGRWEGGNDSKCEALKRKRAWCLRNSENAREAELLGPGEGWQEMYLEHALAAMMRTLVFILITQEAIREFKQESQQQLSFKWNQFSFIRISFHRLYFSHSMVEQ